MMESIEVTARFTQDGRVYPQRISWRGNDYPVESTGRSWQDPEGLHILIMIPRERVLELIFQSEPGLWFLKTPPPGQRLA